MGDDLDFMRAHSSGSQVCGACAMEATMTPEHLEAFRKSYTVAGINTTGVLAWLEAKGYTIDRKAPRKVLLNHREHLADD